MKYSVESEGVNKYCVHILMILKIIIEISALKQVSSSEFKTIVQ